MITLKSGSISSIILWKAQLCVEPSQYLLLKLIDTFNNVSKVVMILNQSQDTQAYYGDVYVTPTPGAEDLPNGIVHLSENTQYEVEIYDEVGYTLTPTNLIYKSNALCTQ